MSSTEFSNASEAASLVVNQGLSLKEACEICFACPDAVERRMQMRYELPYIPTPAMIEAECERFRKQKTAEESQPSAYMSFEERKRFNHERASLRAVAIGKCVDSVQSIAFASCDSDD